MGEAWLWCGRCRVDFKWDAKKRDGRCLEPCESRRDHAKRRPAGVARMGAELTPTAQATAEPQASRRPSCAKAPRTCEKPWI